MKKLSLLLTILLAITFGQAQTYLSQDFSGSTFPPSGWTIDEHAANWSKSPTVMAGGDAPGEAKLHWSPEFVGSTRFISPEIDLTGVTDVSVEFKHMLDFYGGTTEVIGCATRSGGGEWNSIWEVPGATIPAEQLIVAVTNGDVGAADFQVCFYFDGNAYNINDWYIDDISVFTPLAHDVSAVTVLGGTYFSQGDTYAAKGNIYNAGLNTETFDVVCTIYDFNDTEIYTDTQTMTDMAPGVYSDVTFSGFTLPDANSYYRVEIATALTDDMDTDNDMVSKVIYTYITDRESVLLEIGTGTWCVYCPGSAMGADELVENGYNVSVIEYHSGDSYETTSSAARVDYYSITGFPTAFFDGTISMVGGSANQSLYANYVPLVDERNAIKVGIETKMSVHPTERGYTVYATISKYGPVANTNLIAHFAVTESNIPENWFIMDELDYVERLMLPSAEGTQIDLINNDEVTLEYEFEMGAGWVYENIEVVSFIQDGDTREILNGSNIPLATLVGVNEKSLAGDLYVRNFPNPVSTFTTFDISIKENAKVNLDIYSIQGTKVASILDENMVAGDHQVNWNLDNNLSNGIYFVRLQAGENVITKKIMVSK